MLYKAHPATHFEMQTEVRDTHLYHLTDGIYERVVKYYDAETDTLISKERHWVLVEGDAIAEYEDDEFDYDSVLSYVADPHFLEV